MDTNGYIINFLDVNQLCTEKNNNVVAGVTGLNMYACMQAIWPEI